MENTKEIAFNEMELVITKPVLSSNGVLEVSGNFTELAEKIQNVVDKYKGTILTDENVNYVKALKVQFQQIRTGIEKKRKDWKSLYLTTPAKLLDAMCDDLQNIVASGENALKEQLDSYDQRRKDELTEILNEYIEDFVKQYGLKEEYRERIVLKKQYYNKTAKEEDTIDDIEAQVLSLKEEQEEKERGIELVKAELEGSTLADGVYITLLEHYSVADVLMRIKADKKRNEQLNAIVKNPTDACESVVKNPTDACESVVKNPTDEKRERTIWVRYDSAQAKLLKEFLTFNNIEYRIIS